MDQFSALFAFYALLLGLAVAHVTTGFADLYRAKDRVRVGITVPILAVVLLVSVSQQWLSMYNAQDTMKLRLFEIASALGMALPYIFVSRAMLPMTNDHIDLELHYANNRRFIVIVLMIPLMVSLCTNLAYMTVLNEWSLMRALGLMIYIGTRLSCLVVMLIWPAPWVQRMALVMLGLLTLMMMI